MNISFKHSSSVATPPVVRQEIIDTLAGLKMPEDQTFGKAVLPVICAARYEHGRWSDLEVKFDHEHPVSAGSTALQYAQSIFEGMKAYRVEQEEPHLFRPYDHASRFNKSAERLCMPPISQEMYVEAVKLTARLYKDLIPRERECALYLRPAMYGEDYSLAIVPSETYSFTVHAAPTIPFSREMKSVLIERRNSRSAVGGTGGVKAAGNYAASFHSLGRAKALGCATTLWLDPLESRYIEELSLMNFFVVIDGILYTPKMQETFLPGITRRSIISLAHDIGVRVVETRININELQDQITKGEATEAFSTGTAAVVSPIKSLKEEDGREFVFGDQPGPITKILRRTLIDIQEGRGADRYSWMHKA